MSQRNVEQVIGKLVTDEGFRRRFAADPRAVIGELIGNGVTLNGCELRALVAMDPRSVERFAAAIHPCIQKVELPGCAAALPADEARSDVASDVEDVEIAPRRSTNHLTDDRDLDRGRETGPLGDTP